MLHLMNFDFVKNEDANWYIPVIKNILEGLNQDEICYIQDNFGENLFSI